MMNACISHYLVLILAFVDRFEKGTSAKFELCENQMNWDEAKDYYETQSTTLSIFDTQEKMDQIFHIMKNTTISRSLSRLDVWLGLYWDVPTKQHVWINSEPLGSYHAWKPGEPDDLQTGSSCSKCENCVTVVYEPSEANNFTWRSRPCVGTNWVFCFSDETTTYPPSTYLSSTEVTSLLSTTNENQRLPTSTNGYALSVAIDYEQNSEVLTSDQNGPSVTSDYMQKSEIQTSDHNVHDVTSDYMQTSEVPTTDHSGPSVTADSKHTSGTRAIVFCPIWASSICECTIIQNISVVVNGEFGDYIYRIDKKKTSSYRRKHSSVRDERFSARCIGLTGSAVLIIVVLSFVFLDINRMSNRRQKKN